jgi:adenylate kinase
MSKKVDKRKKVIKRDEMLLVRLTAEEQQRLQAEAIKQGGTVSEFVRSKVFGSSPGAITPGANDER